MRSVDSQEPFRFFALVADVLGDNVSVAGESPFNELVELLTADLR
jgi:hypothetical protein